MQTNSKWEIPKEFYSKWDTVEPNYLSLVLTQSEKFLSELVRAGEQISEKGYKILTINLSVIGGIFLYFITGKQSPEITVSTILAGLSSVASIGFLVKPLWFYNTMVIGSSPNKLLRKEYLRDVKTKESQFKSLTISECYNYQERIDLNNKINNSRAHQINISTLFLIGGIGISIIGGFWCSYFFT